MEKVGVFTSDRDHKAITVAALLLIVIALMPVAGLQAQEISARGRGRSTGPATNPSASDSEVRGGTAGVGAFNSAMPPRIFPVIGEGPTCAFDATIYEVRVPANQIGRLDLDTLARAAATPDAFEKAMAQLGTSRSLYRVNQTIRLAGDTITIGATIPYVSHSQITTQGNAINSVTYSNVGALFDILGSATTADKIELDLYVGVSTLSESTVEIAVNVKPPLFRQVAMAHKGPVEARQPFVLVSIDAASADAAGNAVGYIARITLGTPSPAMDSAQGK